MVAMNEWMNEWEKKVLWFFWNLAQIKFTINKCAKFSSFGEKTFLWEWNTISSLRFGKNFTKDFNVKNIFNRNSLFYEQRSKLNGILLYFFKLVTKK